jgi:6-pyruvoyl-tetrahydropterin synthase
MNRDRFVYFDDTGEIIKITNYLEEDETSFIKIDYSKVEKILQGTVSSFDYVVLYDVMTRDYVIKPKVTNNEIIHNVSDRIYEIPKNVNDPDFTIIQDKINKCWKFKINKEILDNFTGNTVLITVPLMFSITKKGNPNTLYRMITIKFSDILDTIDFSIPFMYSEENTETFSIYTIRKMQSYNYEVLDE